MVAGIHDADPGELHLEPRPLRGGLQATSLTRLRIHHRDASGKPRVHTVVVKHLVGPAAREAGVYQRLLSAIPAAAPQLLAADVSGPGEAVLYLEALRPTARWPWKDVANARAVLERIAILHQAALPDEILGHLSLWDYERELLVSAERTLELLQRLRRGAPVFRSGIRWARRLVSALPAVRRQLLEFRPFGTAPLHGDLHSGNVILRRHQGRDEPILLDWARARIGSPLEDVSSSEPPTGSPGRRMRSQARSPTISLPWLSKEPLRGGWPSRSTRSETGSACSGGRTRAGADPTLVRTYFGLPLDGPGRRSGALWHDGPSTRSL
jgi:hypothetical protein